ncbi:hypothetical protein ACFLZB_04975 [Nanoarchaeota archaeon]
MKDHILKENENKWNCLYCHKCLGPNKWTSEWSGELHYKVTQCNCGKKHRVKVDFFGSGHDDWEKQVNWIFNKEGKLKIENKKKKSVEDKIWEELERLDHT